MERKQQIIESLLAKPTKKPDFSSFKGSDILKRAQEFMPKFIQTTDRLLADPDLLKKHQMDVQIVDKDQNNLEEEDQNMDNQQEGTQQQITMDIGVGLYDVLNENFNEKDFKPTSTEPIVKIQGMQELEDDENIDGSGSDDSDLFLEFNSDSDKGEVTSATTKSSHLQTNKRPLIVDITPQEDNQSKGKTLNIKKKNNKKRQRKH